MIPHRLWQTYTQKGSSVYRQDAGIPPDPDRQCCAFVVQLSCTTNAQQMHNKQGLSRSLLFGKERLKALMLLGFIYGYGRT
ncbi:hypothetical protein QUB06_10395 [Microcoleus sp. D2_18a_D3]